MRSQQENIHPNRTTQEPTPILETAQQSQGCDPGNNAKRRRLSPNQVAVVNPDASGATTFPGSSSGGGSSTIGRGDARVLSGGTGDGVISSITPRVHQTLSETPGSGVALGLLDGGGSDKSASMSPTSVLDSNNTFGCMNMYDEATLKDLADLSEFVRGICTKRGMDMESFQSRRLERARELKNNPAVCQMFDLDTVVPARQASEAIFQDTRASPSMRKDLALIHTWQETYLHRLMEKKPQTSSDISEIREITKEVCLEDDLQEFSVCFIALLSSNFENGIDELYDTFIAACSQKMSDGTEDIRECLIGCMDILLKQAALKSKDIGFSTVILDEQYHDIPPEYAHIFPDAVYLLEYTSEGLRTTFERFFMALVYPDAVRFTRQLHSRGLYSSHVMLPREYQTTGGAKSRYTLYNDFIFGSVSVGDDADNMVYVSVEGRCINSSARSVFLNMGHTWQLSVKFWISKEHRRRFCQYQVASMAKYQISPERMHRMHSLGFSTDHLSMQILYGQPTMLMIADWFQQASNKRPVDRQMFQSESLRGKEIYASFENLPEPRKAIATACTEHVHDALQMVRLEKGYAKQTLEQMLSTDALDDAGEVWVGVVVCPNTFFFEREQCIWIQDQNQWIFLEDCMATVRRTMYRSMQIASAPVLVHRGIGITKLHAAAIRTGHKLSDEFLYKSKLEDFARRLDNGGVEIKVAWRTQNGLEWLEFDHINQKTGDNLSSNLRVVDSQQNKVLAVGKSRQATIHRFDDSNVEGSLDQLVVVGETSIELAEKIQRAMAQMKYPEEYLKCRQSTVFDWVRKMEPILALHGKIVIKDVSSQCVVVDNDGDDDDDDLDDGSLNHRRLWWYVATFQDKDGMLEYEVYRGKLNMCRGIKDRLCLAESTKYLYDVFRGFMNEPDEERRKSHVKHIGYDGLVDLYSSHRMVLSFATYDLRIRDGVPKTCVGCDAILDELEKDEIVFQSIKQCIRNSEDDTDEIIRMKVVKTLNDLVKSHLRRGRIYGESNVRGALTRLGVKITQSGDHMANTNTGKGQVYLVEYEDGTEASLTHRQIWEMLGDGQWTSSSSVYDWVANAKTTGVVHETLRNVGIVKIEEGHGEDSPKPSGIGTTVRITYPPGTPGMNQTESFASKAKAASFILKQATLKNKPTVNALLKRMRTKNEFTDDNSVKFTMESSTERKRVAIPVYAIVVKDQISSKGMELVKNHVISWDNQLPEFVLKANPENGQATVDAVWKKIGTTFENIKASFRDESLVCLKFAGFTQGRKSVEDFLKCVMMLPAKDSKSIIKKMQEVCRAQRTDAWCKLIFTESAFLKRVNSQHLSFKTHSNGFKAEGTVSL